MEMQLLDLFPIHWFLDAKTASDPESSHSHWSEIYETRTLTCSTLRTTKP
jgi:hypothetical protein